MTITVTDVPEQLRFEARDDDGRRLGLVEYVRSDGTITLTHTEVDPAVEGQGIGSQLAQAVLDRARTEGLAVRPECPFIRRWIDRHPDYSDLVH